MKFTKVSEVTAMPQSQLIVQLAFGIFVLFFAVCDIYFNKSFQSMVSVGTLVSSWILLSNPPLPQNDATDNGQPNFQLPPNAIAIDNNGNGNGQPRFPIAREIQVDP